MVADSKMPDDIAVLRREMNLGRMAIREAIDLTSSI